MNRTIKAPEIQVGILSVAQISFTLNGIFEDESRTSSMTGKWIAHCSGEKIYLHDDKQKLEFNGALILKPRDPQNSSFVLQSVMIGVDFHWQRNEDQIFYGNLKIITEDRKVTAINILSIEDYLISVISSEMKATASKEFLKAHAVISRSWLLAQLDKKRSAGKETGKYSAYTRTDDEIVRWYDREDHSTFDVCADDHCQRYQGITRASTPAVVQVIDETYGEVLTYNGSICDTRYYKCCGGVTELFENVWEPVNHPYLQKVMDNPVLFEEHDLNLVNNIDANSWIKDNPDAFCNTNDKDVLEQVLNDYDQETNDFFRWRLTYRQSDLSELIKDRTGIDFGTVTDLLPLERGVSGRIIRLRIEGTKRIMVIGKELEIRKALSRTHLYSSCFVVEKNRDEEGITFVIYGAGWGHGVGLCQIGAAVMGSKGYSYNEILMHYFRGAVLEKRY